MKRLGKSIVILFLTMTMIFGSCMTVFATGNLITGAADGDTSYHNLMNMLLSGEITDLSRQKSYDYSNNRYKRNGGGYYYYIDLFANMYEQDNSSGKLELVYKGQEPPFDDGKLSEMTSKARQDFLTDVMTLAYIYVDNCEGGYSYDGVTTETVSRFTEVLQQQSGLGSALLASLLQNTKPDYVTANRIWQPFSGPIGVILGLLSIAVIALLGVSMAFDLCYINIPAVQMALSDGEAGGGGQGGQGGKPKGLSGFVSIEAKKAVDMAANGGGNGQGGSGDYKAATGQYFKFRWKGLVMLVICILYLVQGEIYSLIGMFIDLFSGLLG